MQFDRHHLTALSAVLRLGSFEAAAAELSVTPSAVSQRIKALEDRVGVVLVNRGAPCTGTPAGLRLAKHAEDVGLLEAQLSRELALDMDAGPTRLRIAVNADSLATWFVGAMASVPGLLFELAVDDQDHSAEWLKRGEVSAAVCGVGKPVTGCDVTALGEMRYVAVASPDFMARWFPEGVTPRALARAPCLSFGPKDALQRNWIAQTFDGARVSPPAHVLPSTQAFVEAARLGIGWGLNPMGMVRGHMRKGRLVPLVPHTPLDVPLFWQVSRVMAAALEPVTASVTRSAGRTLRRMQRQDGA
ncbi:LysR family transcriptional regulator ArgP [Jhaorihella thermophila]|uniref:LysR family transcriptional regulator, chromosome initiation inhibitor n=1 Tax=Jhaorihella thermophila TaxID=488547 RepID=A0A1H5YFD7_9RHOB|nr:LysR family transcriptional regulator ArgP [Jhaorihella thermophila]SEG22432.1 LysR family transcriptional regulator, chromosome initiation inhibitor [Jhaorihella thermophila]